MLADQFTQIFREEHRKVRDALLDLMLAFQVRDRGRIRALLNQVAVLTGPHFRYYEEEALYPALVEIFGEEYVAKLMGDHDRAIGIAQSLVALAGKEQLTEQDTARAAQLIRRVLPHVSDCDGLSIMVER
ncbi:MAG: hemerythrin domain-containing protein, partial [Anaerolineae bacterium]|nr:hemerythrin domain-containing protein [Anaerolineae bacterium]